MKPPLTYQTLLSVTQRYSPEDQEYVLRFITQLSKHARLKREELEQERLDYLVGAGRLEEARLEAARLAAELHDAQLTVRHLSAQVARLRKLRSLTSRGLFILERLDEKLAVVLNLPGLLRRQKWAELQQMADQSLTILRNLVAQYQRSESS
jgi:hypothetical protein